MLVAQKNKAFFCILISISEYDFFNKEHFSAFCSKKFNTNNSNYPFCREFR